MEERIPAALAGERVDRVVAMLTDLPRTEAAALVADGHVRLDGTVVSGKSRKVAEGEVLTVEVPERRVAGVAADPSVHVPVVFADDDVIVVDKPAGLVVHPGHGNDRGTMVQGLLAAYPELAAVGEPDRPGVVHRLDAGTSGLLVVARSAAAYSSLVEQLQSRSVDRRYLALVAGTVESPAGVVDAPIGRSGSDPTRMAVRADGREARTAYEVRERFTEPTAATLLECKLETGRTHQIRVHLAAIGHPVLGDPRYGRSPLRVPRPFLHAWRLAFDHPTTGERVSFESALPADLEAVRARFR